MKRFFNFCLLGFVCIASYAQKSEKLLIGGCAWNKIAIIDKATKQIEWEHKFTNHEDCNDLQITSGGDVLYAYNRGARLINMKQEVIWDFKVKPGEELFTAKQLKNGKYMLAMCGNPARIVELNKKGEIVSEKTFDTGIERSHSQFRQISVKKRGGYVIPLMGKKEVIETNKKMEVIRRIKCGGSPFSVLLTDDNLWIVSCGDGHKLVTIDPKKEQIIDTVDSSSLKTVKMNFVAEALRYANGNILFANWNGHTKDKTQPLLVEFDKDKNVVWTLYPSKEISNISAVYSFYR